MDNNSALSAIFAGKFLVNRRQYGSPFEVAVINTVIDLNDGAHSVIQWADGAITLEIIQTRDRFYPDEASARAAADEANAASEEDYPSDVDAEDAPAEQAAA